MTNIVELFPNPTDRQYENELVPALVNSLARITCHVEDGQFNEYNIISQSLLRFAGQALILLDHLRKEGFYEDGKMLPMTASDIDNLAADCVLAFGGEGAEEIARRLRNRTRVKGDDE